MLYPDIAAQLISMKNADNDLRQTLVKSGELFNGYNSEMEALHNQNALHLDQIIETIGYPTPAKVGEEGSAAAWLIIQHAISQPPFMKKCLDLLKQTHPSDTETLQQVAYLSDRIAVFENQPQLYGSQFDWDQEGHLSPQPYDDITLVNERRKLIGLNTLEEQTLLIRQRAEEENESPPKDLSQRNLERDEWKKKVGWIV